MNAEMTPETVAQDMFTVLHGQPAPVVTRWTYSAADPFAVTLGIRGRRDRFVEWLVARDLVLASLAGNCCSSSSTRPSPWSRPARRRPTWTSTRRS